MAQPPEPQKLGFRQTDEDFLFAISIKIQLLVDVQAAVAIDPALLQVFFVQSRSVNPTNLATFV
ncbi:hypothetical protein [Algoriphagus jejuensis]